MKAIVKQVQGTSMAAKADSNHWIFMDGPEEFGGSNAGSRPLELFLMGLGGCTSMDVISILKKKRIKIHDFECHLEADRADEHPKVFTNIKLKFKIFGKNISPEAVERAIELSETKYCSASAMLKKSVNIETEFEILETQND